MRAEPPAAPSAPRLRGPRLAALPFKWLPVQRLGGPSTCPPLPPGNSGQRQPRPRATTRRLAPSTPPGFPPCLRPALQRAPGAASSSPRVSPAAAATGATTASAEAARPAGWTAPAAGRSGSEHHKAQHGKAQMAAAGAAWATGTLGGGDFDGIRRLKEAACCTRTHTGHLGAQPFAPASLCPVAGYCSMRQLCR